MQAKSERSKGVPKQTRDINLIRSTQVRHSRENYPSPTNIQTRAIKPMEVSKLPETEKNYISGNAPYAAKWMALN